MAMQSRSKMLKKAFTTAFPYTIPIFAGFWFLGITYGIYHECVRIQFLVSDAHERDDICRLDRICDREYAPWGV